MKSYFILTLEQGSPYSEEVSTGLLVSKNEKALLAAAKKLSLFTKENQYLEVNSIIGSWIENNEYTIVREEISEFDFYTCIDLYEKELIIDLKNLTNDQEIIKIPVVDNYTNELMNTIATDLFGSVFIRNDFKKASSYWKNKDLKKHILVHDF